MTSTTDHLNSRHAACVDPVVRDAPGPLSGIVVADFGRVLAGPYCTMLLGDLGASIIKVESASGDETRTWRPPVHDDESTYFLSINRNKRSIVLDLTDPDDQAAARRLALRADVMVENFKPGGMARFGLNYESVVEDNPGLIYASITGFGTDGGAEVPGYDLLVQAISGLMSITGSPETTGYRSGIAVFDVITGLHAAIGILSALHHRSATGEGQHIEVNLLSSALSAMTNQTVGTLLTGNAPSRLGNEHPSIYPYAPFPARVGELILGIGNDRQFRTFCSVVGLDHLPEDPRFATNVARSTHREALRPILLERLSDRTAEEWFDVFTPAGIPCAPILDVAGGIDFARRLGLDPVVTAGRGGRTVPGIRNPIRFSRTQPSYDVAPPLQDEAHDAVRAWIDSM